MLIYLLKATLVWGFSLLLFELLLRKSSRHTANRAYLLATLIAGFIIPFIEWPAATMTTVEIPTWQTFETIPTAGQPAASIGESSRQPDVLSICLFCVYGCGVAVSLARIAREAIALKKIRRASYAQALPGGYTLLKTGAVHGPFSFFRQIFLSDYTDYTGEELEMLIAHEQEHGRLLHSLDMVLMEALKVALWFHPLMHLYARRLRLVHEYEADAAACSEPISYGRFLLAQTLLSSTPTLAHSFHSPLKNRILMLTKRKTGAAVYALVLPLLSAILVCCSRLSDQPDEAIQVGNRIHTKGHVLELKEVKNMDTILYSDHLSGAIERLPLEMLPTPGLLDGKKIYKPSEVTTPATYAGMGDAYVAVVNRLQGELKKLPDGSYLFLLPNPIVSAEGEVVYMRRPSIRAAGKTLYPIKTAGGQSVMKFPTDAEAAAAERELPAIPTNLQKRIVERAETIVREELEFRPAKLNGQKVPAYYDGDFVMYPEQRIVVRGGKVSYEPGKRG